MKQTLSIIILAFFCLEASAQVPTDSLSLSDLTFVRQGFVRNFYNSSKVISSLNLEGTDMFLKNSNCLVIEGENVPAVLQKGSTLVFNGGGDAFVRVGAFHPYLSYESSWTGMRKGASVGIAFRENDGDGCIEVRYRDGEIAALINGKTMSSASTGTLKDLNLRVQYTGRRFHVFRLREKGEWDLLMSVACDMSRVDMPVKWSFGVVAGLPTRGSVTLTGASSALTCGTGQADPQVFQHKDGTPLMKGSRLMVAFTTRGFEKIPDSYQGIYSLDPDSCDLRLEGALFFGEGDGRLHGYHATKIVYDDDSGRFLVMTTTHGGNHTLAWCETDADLTSGMHYLECTELDFPHNYTRGGKVEGRKSCIFATEDPDFLYDSDAGKWRLAYCALQGKDLDSQHLSYHTFLCESDKWNGPYTQIAVSKEDNNTGIRIASVGGRRYVLSGGSDTTFYIYDYPSLKYVGTFNQKYENGGFRGWPTIVPLQYGDYERYLWITFDRGWITGRYSYGTLYFYMGDKMWRRQPSGADPVIPMVKKVTAEPTEMRYGDPSRHDYLFAKDPTVIRKGRYYYMYYSLDPFDEHKKPEGVNREVASWHCGIAKSEDLINWNRVSDMKLLTTSGEEIGYDAAPCVKSFDGQIYLFYQRACEATGENAIWLAKSDDGITFTNVYDEPIFIPRSTWCIPRAIDAEAYRVGDKMILMYATREFPTRKIQQTGMAEAPYGSDYGPDKWKELSTTGPVFKPEAAWEYKCIEGNTVVEVDGVYYMFYAGSYNNGTQQIGLATSTDGYNFTRVNYFEDAPGLFYPLGPEGSWNAHESGHPGVFKDLDGKVYLFFQGKAGGNRTDDPYLLSVLKLTFTPSIPS